MTVSVYTELVAAADESAWLHGNNKYKVGSSVARDYFQIKVVGTFTGEIELHSRRQIEVSGNPIVLEGPTSDLIDTPGDYSFLVNGQSSFKVVAASTFSGSAEVILESGSTPTRGL